MIDIGKYTKEFKELITASDHILLICHINPDGDAAGAMLAMRRWILTQGKEAGMISPNALQNFLLWMTDTDRIVDFHHNQETGAAIIKEADLIIMMDFNTSSRMGKAEEFILASPARKVMIDHHPEPDHIADLIISDTDRSSTSELVYSLVRELNNGDFNDKAFSEAIYVGIVTDTGNFEHGLYNGDTMRTVGTLLDQGVDKDRILNRVFSNFSADRIQLKGYALDKRMVVLPEYHAAYIWLTKEDLEKHKHQKGDTEGFANMLLTIAGVVLSVLFIERSGFTKISLRSKGNFNANALSRMCFNGGGHRNAAGGEMAGRIENAVTHFRSVLPQFKQDLDAAALEVGL